MKIILDNGHGENTSGKQSPKWGDGSQLFEYEFNRDIVGRISLQLASQQIPFEILVPEITDIGLTERANRANKIFEEHPGSVLISVHANAAPKEGTASGWEVLHYPNSSEGIKLAQVFSKEYDYASFGFPNRGLKPRSDLAILRLTKCPSIITENLFMNTEKDCRYIMSDEGRQKIANFHIDAIKKYLEGFK